ncbi:hypothetical protein [Streptomyces sp. NPDC048442]
MLLVAALALPLTAAALECEPAAVPMNVLAGDVAGDPPPEVVPLEWNSRG